MKAVFYYLMSYLWSQLGVTRLPQYVDGHTFCGWAYILPNDPIKALIARLFI